MDVLSQKTRLADSCILQAPVGMLSATFNSAHALLKALILLSPPQPPRRLTVQDGGGREHGRSPAPYRGPPPPAGPAARRSGPAPPPTPLCHWPAAPPTGEGGPAPSARPAFSPPRAVLPSAANEKRRGGRASLRLTDRRRAANRKRGLAGRGPIARPPVSARLRREGGGRACPRGRAPANRTRGSLDGRRRRPIAARSRNGPSPPPAEAARESGGSGMRGGGGRRRRRPGRGTRPRWRRPGGRRCPASPLPALG